jgi:HCOMODA/2-hydroxy-3-carboxy-muconic semialdehyde decarboxylase
MANPPKLTPSPSGTAARIQVLKTDLVTANRILLRHKIVDAFGHVSVRHPTAPERFLMAKRTPPGLVKIEDILEFGLDGNLIENNGSPVFLERFIHSEIYASRADVHAIVHSHSPDSIAFGLAPSNPLRPVCHTCGFLNRPTPIFDMRAVAGDGTNLLISCTDHGRELAKVLGNAGVVLMRGHGSTTVGSTLGQAVYRAIYTEANARIQATASNLGQVSFLSSAEADAAEVNSHLQVERAWQFWESELLD